MLFLPLPLHAAFIVGSDNQAGKNLYRFSCCTVCMCVLVVPLMYIWEIRVPAEYSCILRVPVWVSLTLGLCALLKGIDKPGDPVAAMSCLDNDSSEFYCDTFVSSLFPSECLSIFLPLFPNRDQGTSHFPSYLDLILLQPLLSTTSGFRMVGWLADSQMEQQLWNHNFLVSLVQRHYQQRLAQAGKVYSKELHCISYRYNCISI